MYGLRDANLRDLYLQVHFSPMDKIAQRIYRPLSAYCLQFKNQIQLSQHKGHVHVKYKNSS